MNSRTVATSALLSAGFLVCTFDTSAAGAFSEALKEKLVCASGSTCTVVRTGKFKINTVAFADDDLSPVEFDESSVVHFAAGNVSFDGTLGDDPNYVAGDSSATFLKTHLDSTSGKTVVDMKITLKGGSSGVKVVVTGKISEAQSPVLADQYIGMTGTISDTTMASFHLATHVDDNPAVPIIGTASVKTVTKDGQGYNLSTVKIKTP